MSAGNKILSFAIDGMWTAMDLARLLHLFVRFYRLELVIHRAGAGGPRIFDDRLDPVILKYLAAFDWIAAPLMSGKFNQSFDRSERFVRDFGLSDPYIHEISYASPGRIAFAGLGPVIDRLHAVLEEVHALHQPNSTVARDSQGRYAALEAMYAANMRAKAELMRHMGYSDAELHAIVSPSIEDLHFISNAMTQGRILALEKTAVPR